jgi:pseudouridine synthase
LEEIRIQKWLSQLGVTSRREAEMMIKEGRVAVNGRVVTELGTKIDADKDSVTIDGKRVKTQPPSKVYWLFHKPDMTLTSRAREGGKQTIFDLPCFSKLTFKVAAAGRLDYRSEGLLILSNDGEMIHRLTHPKFKVPRYYNVLINGKLTREQLTQIRKGVVLEDGPVQKVDIKYVHGQALGKSSGSWYMVTVYEGRNRLVRRIFGLFDQKVLRLVRMGFGDIRLPEALAPGKYLQLKPEQIKYLKSITEMND